MPLMGNIKDARRAIYGDMEFVGSGCSRSVYLNDDETLVYKVARSRRQGCNIGEHLFFEALANVPKWAKHVVKSRLIDVAGQYVLTMPYLPLEPRYEEMTDFINSLRRDRLLWDMFEANARIGDDGILKIIDAGEWGYDDGIEVILQIALTGKGM